MLINNFKSYNTDFSLIYDGNCYAVNSNTFGLVAYTTRINRDFEAKTIAFDFIIPCGCPFELAKLVKVISDIENKYVKQSSINFNFIEESPKTAGGGVVTNIENATIKLNIKQK